MKTKPAIRVLHITPHLTLGGAGRSLIELRRCGKALEECVVSLLPADCKSSALAREAGMSVLEAPSHAIIARQIEVSDLVLIHFWNTPELYELLLSKLPAMRLIIWLKVFGRYPPQVVTRELLRFADVLITTSPSTCNLPVCQAFLHESGERKIEVVPGIADFSRLSGFQARRHSGFNVGYIGTVDFVKLHPNYVAMSAQVKAPDVRFIVCGSGNAHLTLQKQARQLGMADRFDLRRHVEDINSVLEVLDVFGYPLCEDTYATSEKSLQEALYVGVPPVVFRHGGVEDLIEHQQTGLIVNSEREYAQAIEYLYHYPQERIRLGSNGAAFVREAFDAERSARKIHDIYEHLLKYPPRERILMAPLALNDAGFPLSYENAEAAPVTSAGVLRFLQSLGETAPQFTRSMLEQDIHNLLQADHDIAMSSPVLCSANGGGLFHYRKHYPNDPYLRFWSGLVLRQQGRLTLAIAEWDQAIKLGFGHWRASWHLAETAHQSGAINLANKELARVLREAPAFEPAQYLLTSLKASVSP